MTSCRWDKSMKYGFINLKLGSSEDTSILYSRNGPGLAL